MKLYKYPLIFFLFYTKKLLANTNRYSFPPDRIIKHRKIMANAVGVPVNKYNKEYVFIKNYESISEAARQNNITKEGISNVLSGQAKTAGGYIWRKANFYNI